MPEQQPPSDGTPPHPEELPPRPGSLFNDPGQGAPSQPPAGYAPPAPPPTPGYAPPTPYTPQPGAAPAGQPAWQQAPAPSGWPQAPAEPSYAPAPAGGAQFVKPGAAAPAYGAPGYGPPVPPAPGSPGDGFAPAAAPPGATITDRLPWAWWVGPLAVFAGFMAVIGAALVVGGIATAAGLTDLNSVEDDLTEVLTLLQQAMWIGVAMLVPYFAVRWLRRDHLGLSAGPNVGRSIGIGAACLVAFYVLTAVYAAALGLDEDSNELLQNTGFGDSILRDVVLAAVFTIGAPVSEELLFRALLFGSLAAAFKRKLGVKGVYLAAVVAGTVFGSIHAGQGQDKYLPMLIVLGVLLCLAYYWSGTLYVPIAIHAINNSLATGLNADPSTPLIYVIIVLATPLSVLLAMGIGRFVSARFRSEPPSPPSPLTAQFAPPPQRPAGL